MEKKNIYLDLDGVILDSEALVMDLINKSKPKTKQEWDLFFENIDWKKLFSESKSLNNSVEIIHELQKFRRDIVILTKIHTVGEMRAKAYDLRENRNILLPISFVPSHMEKSQICIPFEGDILVDDSVKNVDDWIKNGGAGILFDESCKEETKGRVRSLDFLLK